MWRLVVLRAPCPLMGGVFQRGLLRGSATTARAPAPVPVRRPPRWWLAQGRLEGLADHFWGPADHLRCREHRLDPVGEGLPLPPGAAPPMRAAPGQPAGLRPPPCNCHARGGRGRSAPAAPARTERRSRAAVGRQRAPPPPLSYFPPAAHSATSALEVAAHAQSSLLALLLPASGRRAGTSLPRLSAGPSPMPARPGEERRRRGTAGGRLGSGGVRD